MSRRPAPDLMTIEQAAEELGVSKMFFYNRAAGRQGSPIPGLRRIGRWLRIDRKVFYEALEKGEVR